MDKEQQWLEKRVGMITASELGQIVSASGRIIDGNLSYIRAKRWERRHGFSHPVTSWQMEVGNQQEVYIFKWASENLGLDFLLYSKDMQEIPFWVAPDCPMAASPDAFTADETIVLEFKTLVGNTAIEFFGDDDTAYEEKKEAVWKEHGPQLLGQFISNPRVQEIWLIKYIYQSDDIAKDVDSPLAPWRGIVFKFARKDYVESIAEMKGRIMLIDAMIDSHVNPSSFKKGKWEVSKDGVLRCVEP